MAGEQKPLLIEWTDTATRQLLSILEYWINRNKSTNFAEKLADLVWDKVRFIACNPNASPKTIFQNTYKAAFGHYSIFYKIIGSKILITAFWDNRQDPKKLIDLLNKQ